MLKNRYFEEKVDEFFAQGKIHGTTHLSIGQEACAAGAMAAIETGDYITATHRGHGQTLAKGADVNRMMAELLGKATGYCKGKGGSMHIADIESGNLGANGVVGGGIAIAVGAALALKMQKRPNVVLCFFGDGAIAQGVFHESANLASVWKLPVVFVCENNQYAMSISNERALACRDAAIRGQAYGMPGEPADGNDVLAVYGAVKKAVDRARRGEGPGYVELQTYRWKGHSKSDANRYRTKEEIAQWKLKDPIKRFRTLLIENGVIDEAVFEAMDRAAREAVEKAVEFAQNSPDPGLEELTTDVYVETAAGGAVNA
ncbi:MAG: thiamine pyrophosphate-dependent dehydrogenase E1 component subunit alpha [Firmicutes bacterium]|nr:thiamine pyrophosphate-dependent dehydrogenase E1 component subunit alpha [Bacillota bacterium]